MRFEPTPFTSINWENLPAEEFPGETGTASVRTVEAGDVRIRLVEYGPGYRADHWCDRGHVVYVTEGTCVMEIQDGREFVIGPGMSFCVGDGIDLHRVRTETGCRAFVVD